MAQAVMYDDLFFYRKPYEVERLKERFYPKPRTRQNYLAPFGLRDVGAQFSLLPIGLLAAFATFIYEKLGICNRRKQKEAM